MNEGDEVNPRKIRTGMMIVGAVTVLSIVLLLAVDDPTARFVFGFVAIASLIQTWRLRRRNRSFE